MEVSPGGMNSLTPNVLEDKCPEIQSWSISLNFLSINGVLYVKNIKLECMAIKIIFEILKAFLMRPW